MKKILIVPFHSLVNAGVQNVLMNIVRNLKDDYIFDALLFTSGGDYFEQEFLSFGGRIFRLPNYEGKNTVLSRGEKYFRWMKYAKVKRILQNNGPYDAIHCNYDLDNAYILRAARDVGIPVRITHIHSIFREPDKLWQRIFYKTARNHIIKFSTRLIGCSQKANDAFYGKDISSLIVNNPYNSDKFIRNTTPKNNGDQLVITQVATYCTNKNQLFSIEVLKNLLDSHENAVLHLVGFEIQSGYLEKIKAKTEELHLADRVFLWEKDTDTAKLLSESSYFLFPSHSEGFGLVLVEAQAMGVRCFSSDTVPQETNCGGVTYLSLDLGPEKWAEVIKADYESTRGIHGIFDCSRFEAKAVAQQFRDIYEDSISAQREKTN